MSIIEGRNAEILQSIIDGKPYENTNPYPSRIEQLLMELKEVIEEGGGATVDQTYTPTSENAQSGTAVAEALGTIPSVTVDQTFDAASANAQSGVAVQEAISSDKYTLSSYNVTGRVIASMPIPTASNVFDTTFYFYLSTTAPQSLPTGSYMASCQYGLIKVNVFVEQNVMNMSGILTERAMNTQYNVGDIFNGSTGYIRLIKL